MTSAQKPGHGFSDVGDRLRLLKNATGGEAQAYVLVNCLRKPVCFGNI